jgi:hypothetical protein
MCSARVDATNGKFDRAGSRPEMPIARLRPPRKFPIVPALPVLKVQIIVPVLREKGREPPRLPGQHAVIQRMWNVPYLLKGERPNLQAAYDLRAAEIHRADGGDDRLRRL